MTERLAERVRELRRVTGGSEGSGWMADATCQFLYGLVKLVNPATVIQTGHLWGKSACVILEALTDGAEIEGKPEGSELLGDPKFTAVVESRTVAQAYPMLFSIDPGPFGVPRSDDGIALLQQWYGLAFRYVPVSSAGWFAGATYFELPLLGIVDGDHSYKGARTDIEGLANLGAAAILVDDTDWLSEVRNAALDFSLNKIGYQYIDLPWLNGLGLMVKETR